MLALTDRGLSRLGLERLALAARAADFVRHGEPEVRLLSQLVDPLRIALDIGAADGVYAWHLHRLSARVIAFEPNPISFARLQRALPEVELHRLALSDGTRRAQLRIPVRGRVAAAGWGTVHAENDLAEAMPERIASFEVETARLDDLAISGVGFMKIDVEGHEREVLDGAHALLARDRPALLIEIGSEKRGGQPAAVLESLARLGYRTEMLDAFGGLVPVAAYPEGCASINIVARNGG